MSRIRYSAVIALAALVVALGGGNATGKSENAAAPVAKGAAAAPTEQALVMLEKSAYEAWKTRDAKFWDTFLSDRFVGYGSSGRLDKASATREYTGAECTVSSYALSDEEVRPLGTDVALLTYRTTVDATCGGQRVPSNTRAAGIYVREGNEWKGVFHAEAPIVDPKAAPATPAGMKETGPMVEARAADRDDATAALMAAEKAIWEAWKDHDASRLGDLTADEISFINIFGVFYPTKADVIRDWTGPGCDIESISVTDGVATMLSPTLGILTHTGAADGTCFGQQVGSVWGTSVYVKDGDAWKWAFGINLPARRQGG